MITSGHMPFSVTLDETLDSGINAIEHLYYVHLNASTTDSYFNYPPRVVVFPRLVFFLVNVTLNF